MVPQSTPTEQAGALRLSPQEAFVALLYVPNQGVRMVWRQTAGASAEVGETIPVTAPVWLRLVRQGDGIVGTFSTDGQSWIGAAHAGMDWTRGCIAVTDREMDEIWELVDDGTPIEIRP